MERAPLSTLLTGSNYVVWAMKMEAILSIRKLKRALIEKKPEETAEIEEKIDCEMRNQDTIAYVRLHLLDEQALQFAAENNARELWSKIKKSYI